MTYSVRVMILPVNTISIKGINIILCDSSVSTWAWAASITHVYEVTCLWVNLIMYSQYIYIFFSCSIWLVFCISIVIIQKFETHLSSILVIESPSNCHLLIFTHINHNYWLYIHYPLASRQNDYLPTRYFPWTIINNGESLQAEILNSVCEFLFIRTWSC